MRKIYHDRNWLWGRYIVREESMATIAKEARCNETTIGRCLRGFDVPIRSLSDYGANSLWRDRDWLYEHYIVREESMSIMAEGVGCEKEAIRRWLHKHKIPVRSCGEGLHFAIRNSVIITPALLEFLEGEILGDGGIYMQGNYSARYEHSSKYKEYLIWLSGRLSEWGIEQSGRITQSQDKRSEFHGAIGHQYKSRSYPELTDIRKRWYSKRDGKMKKTVPRGFKLTPIKARQWHLGDGCLTHGKRNRPYINLSTNDFDHSSIKRLIRELGGLGFKATHQLSDNTINISVHSTKEFLEWIGPCPVSCYDYRWDYEDKLKWRRQYRSVSP